MGQDFVIANLDKEQFISPFDMDDGAKLWEFAGREKGPTMLALVLLLTREARFPGPGGELIGGLCGSWFGDRIAIVGLYMGPPPFEEKDLYAVVRRTYENISGRVLQTVQTVRAYLSGEKLP
jgi:hypothetical protein